MASAAAAGLADASPTGLATADLAWRCLVGALVPLFASRAMRWTWIVLAAVASAFASGEMQLVAMAGLVAAGGSMTMDRRDETLGALVAALAVNALFHLDPIVGHGVPTVIAFAACSPVLVSGYRYGTLAGRRLARTATRVAAVALVAVVVVAGGSLLLARTSLERGVDAAGMGLHYARAGNTDLAREQFERAEQALDRGVAIVGGPWVAPARAIPVVGQHVDATDDLARAGSDAVGAGSAASAVLGDEALTIQAGRVNLEAVAATEQSLAEVITGIDDALAMIEHTDTSWLLPPLADRIHHLRQDLVDSRGSAETAMLATQVVPSMLGAGDSRNYLILLVNPAESRDLGGVVSHWALVSADDGHLELVDMGRPADELGGVTASPDFPTVASAASELFSHAGVAPVDGVMMMDPAAVAAVASLSGPVTIPQLSRPIEPGELERFLVIDQYELFPDLGQRDAMVDTLLWATFSRLLTESTPGPERIGAAFDRVVTEDRLLVWTGRAEEAPLLERAGLDGGLAGPGDGLELLSVRTANLGGNRMDPYLERSITHVGVIDPDTGAYSATTSVILRSDPPDGLPAHVVGGSDPELPAGFNHQRVSLYTPHPVEEVRVDGVPVPADSRDELGWMVHSVTVVVGPGGEVEVEFDLDGNATTDGYRLLWDAQPMVNADILHIDVRLGDERFVGVEAIGARDIELAAEAASG